MRNDTVGYLISGALIILLQGLVLQRIQIGGPLSQYFSILLYPVIIMTIPMKTSRFSLVFLGFAIGILVDLFYGSLGVHASATVFTAFIRPFILKVFEPRGGYSVNATPTPSDLGMQWFLQYAAVLLFLHLAFYFSVEVFNFTYIGHILLKVLTGFILSYAAIVLFVFLFNPR